MTSKEIIMLVDDEEEARFLWEATVRQFGYEVIPLAGGEEALSRLDEIRPDLVLLDLNMPGMDGHEVCRRIKRQPRFSKLPVLILTSSDDLNDKLYSFDEGADDYITKEMDPQEIEKRIEAVLRRYRQNLDSNPLTHLPGNNLIQREIQTRIDQGQRFSVGYCDLDNFKAYNDAYGFMEGDRVIRFCADVLTDAIREEGNRDDFIGHIGGDDYVFITTPDKAEAVCQRIVQKIDAGIKQFYNSDDARRGYIVAHNRQGQRQQFPLVGISIAVVSNAHRPLRAPAEVSKIAGELKKAAKQKEGSVYVFDQRTGD